jgi:hypothetical protein
VVVEEVNKKEKRIIKCSRIKQEKDNKKVKNRKKGNKSMRKNK